jgi:hypothetical protein
MEFITRSSEHIFEPKGSYINITSDNPAGAKREGHGACSQQMYRLFRQLSKMHRPRDRSANARRACFAQDKSACSDRGFSPLTRISRIIRPLK